MIPKWVPIFWMFCITAGLWASYFLMLLMPGTEGRHGVHLAMAGTATLMFVYVGLFVYAWKDDD